MKKSTLDHIKLLTDLDTKTLNERVVKLFEEGGELARVVAPYENVSSTRHRIVDKKKILEEAVDCLLVAYSIAHHVDFDDDEIEEMFQQKLLKWHGRLSREQRTKDKPVPYEIHVTVNTGEIDRFRRFCKIIDVKPIVLDLQTLSQESVMQDVMTSSVHLGNNTSAVQTANAIKAELEQAKFPVVRVKIETVPWHPAAPQESTDLMPADCYFESHLAVITSSDRKGKLNTIACEYNAHLSKNVFKVIDESNYVQMMTVRWYQGTYAEFDQMVERFIQDLKQNGFDVDKKIVEFSMYDTRVAHDSTWLSNPAI